MKKRIAMLVSVISLFLSMAIPALAADQFYPSSVEEYTYGDFNELRINKIYQLSLSDDPAGIPTEDFERNGHVFHLLDLIRKDEVLASDPKCPWLAVADSPIDVLSLATLAKLSGGEWRDSHYISLGGTVPRAMLQVLPDHPHVIQVSLCLDNDKGGLTGMERPEQTIREDPELSQRMTLIYRNPSPTERGKDYNEFLCAHIKATQIQQRQTIR